MTLPSGAWQGALISVVGGVIQSISRGQDLNIVQIIAGAIAGALIGMGVAKLWKRRAR